MQIKNIIKQVSERFSDESLDIKDNFIFQFVVALRTYSENEYHQVSQMNPADLKNAIRYILYNFQNLTLKANQVSSKNKLILIHSFLSNFNLNQQLLNNVSTNQLKVITKEILKIIICDNKLFTNGHPQNNYLKELSSFEVIYNNYLDHLSENENHTMNILELTLEEYNFEKILSLLEISTETITPIKKISKNPGVFKTLNSIIYNLKKFSSNNLEEISEEIFLDCRVNEYGISDWNSILTKIYPILSQYSINLSEQDLENLKNLLIQKSRSSGFGNNTKIKLSIIQD